jgi:hypothetical protein
MWSWLEQATTPAPSGMASRRGGSVIVVSPSATLLVS